MHDSSNSAWTPLDDLPDEAIRVLALLRRFRGNLFFSPEDVNATGAYQLAATGRAFIRRHGRRMWYLVERGRVKS